MGNPEDLSDADQEKMPAEEGDARDKWIQKRIAPRRERQKFLADGSYDYRCLESEIRWLESCYSTKMKMILC